MSADPKSDPVEERDILKFLAMLSDPRVRKALLEVVEEQYEYKLEHPEEEGK